MTADGWCAGEAPTAPAVPSGPPSAHPGSAPGMPDADPDVATVHAWLEDVVARMLVLAPRLQPADAFRVAREVARYTRWRALDPHTAASRAVLRAQGRHRFDAMAGRNRQDRAPLSAIAASARAHAR